MKKKRANTSIQPDKGGQINSHPKCLEKKVQIYECVLLRGLLSIAQITNYRENLLSKKKKKIAGACNMTEYSPDEGTSHITSVELQRSASSIS